MLRQAIELQIEVGCSDICYLPNSWQKGVHKRLESAAEEKILKNIHLSTKLMASEADHRELRKQRERWVCVGSQVLLPEFLCVPGSLGKVLCCRSHKINIKCHSWYVPDDPISCLSGLATNQSKEPKDFLGHSTKNEVTWTLKRTVAVDVHSVLLQGCPAKALICWDNIWGFTVVQLNTSLCSRWLNIPL